jgi:hypothetical protein
LGGGRIRCWWVRRGRGQRGDAGDQQVRPEWQSYEGQRRGGGGRWVKAVARGRRLRGLHGSLMHDGSRNMVTYSYKCGQACGLVAKGTWKPPAGVASLPHAHTRGSHKCSSKVPFKKMNNSYKILQHDIVCFHELTCTSSTAYPNNKKEQ